jgi:hypothetical protein
MNVLLSFTTNQLLPWRGSIDFTFLGFGPTGIRNTVSWIPCSLVGFCGRLHPLMVHYHHLLGGVKTGILKRKGNRGKSEKHTKKPPQKCLMSSQTQTLGKICILSLWNIIFDHHATGAKRSPVFCVLCSFNQTRGEKTDCWKRIAICDMQHPAINRRATTNSHNHSYFSRINKAQRSDTDQILTLDYFQVKHSFWKQWNRLNMITQQLDGNS